MRSLSTRKLLYFESSLLFSAYQYHTFSVFKITTFCSTRSTNISNNLPDIDAELDYNDLFSIPSDYYDGHNSINNLLCSKNKSNHLFMIHFNVRSLQKIIDKLSHCLTDLNRKPDVVAVSETKLKRKYDSQ